MLIDRLISSVALVILFAGAGRAAPQQVIPIQGEPFRGELLSIDDQWQVTLDTDGGLRTVPADQLISWGARVDLAPGPEIVLVGGSVISCDIIAADGQLVTVYSRLWGQLSVPRENLQGVIYRPPLDQLAHDRLVRRIRDAQGTEDQMLLENGDLIRGTLRGPDENQPLSLFGQSNLRLQIDGSDVEVPVERVVALIMNPGLMAKPAADARAELGFDDGTNLSVRSVSTGDGMVTIKLVDGSDLRSAPDIWTDLVAARFWNKQISYLSDLPDIGFKHIPYLDTTWSYGRDHNVLGGWLRSGDHIYTKGLGMHSTSRLAYRLSGEERAFEAELALDAQAGQGGSVVFRVFLHDGSGWKLVEQSAVIRGGQPPTLISVELQGARQLALIVDHADRADVRDYANWLSARLVE